MGTFTFYSHSSFLYLHLNDSIFNIFIKQLSKSNYLTGESKEKKKGNNHWSKASGLSSESDMVAFGKVVKIWKSHYSKLRKNAM